MTDPIVPSDPTSPLVARSREEIGGEFLATKLAVIETALERRDTVMAFRALEMRRDALRAELASAAAPASAGLTADAELPIEREPIRGPAADAWNARKEDPEGEIERQIADGLRAPPPSTGKAPPAGTRDEVQESSRLRLVQRPYDEAFSRVVPVIKKLLQSPIGDVDYAAETGANEVLEAAFGTAQLSTPPSEAGFREGVEAAAQWHDEKAREAKKWHESLDRNSGDLNEHAGWRAWKDADDRHRAFATEIRALSPSLPAATDEERMTCPTCEGTGRCDYGSEYAGPECGSCGGKGTIKNPSPAQARPSEGPLAQADGSVPGYVPEQGVQQPDEGPTAFYDALKGISHAAMSWNGFNIFGDRKSIREVQRLENRSSQLEVYSKAFDERIAAERERAGKAEGWAADWHRVVETLLTLCGLSPALGGEEAVIALCDHISAAQAELAERDAKIARLQDALRGARDALDALSRQVQAHACAIDNMDADEFCEEQRQVTDTDLVSCEACGSDADVEACTSMSEGGWLCPKCQADAAADFKSCKHEWVADNRDGDDGWHCMRCSHFVAADSFKGLFGCDSPEEFDQ